MRQEHWCESHPTHQLHYLQTKRWLQNLINEWQVEDSSELDVASELASLATILDKLERSVFQIAVFGMVGRGKSSVLNALANQQVFKTGALHGVTQSIESIELAPATRNREATSSNQAKSFTKLSSVDYSKILTASRSLPDLLSQDDYQVASRNLQRTWQGCIQVFDTPGIDEVDGGKQYALAYRLAKQVDLILFVIAGDLNQVEYDAIAQLQQQGKPVLLVFNKIDQYPELDRLAIYNQIRDRRVKEFISPSEIVMVAAAPVQLRGIVREDGKISRERSPVKPNIRQLEQKIVEIISQKGKPLVVLNNTCAAHKIQQQLLNLKIEQHDLIANNLITKLVCLKAVLIGCNPLAIADLIVGVSVDLGLILALSSLSGVSLSSSGALAVLSVVTLGMAAVGSVDLLLQLGFSYLFSISDTLVATQAHLSVVASGLIGLTQGLIAGFSVIVLGQVAKQQFWHSLAWGDYQARQIIRATLNSLQNDPLVSKIKVNLG